MYIIKILEKDEQLSKKFQDICVLMNIHSVSVVHWFGISVFIFTYLAVLGLGCSMWDLYLQHVQSSSLTREKTRVPCIGSMES